ncbi:MAG: hypothetical protein ACO29O_09705, partial [Chitinophagaceae bacterium]
MNDIVDKALNIVNGINKPSEDQFPIESTENPKRVLLKSQAKGNVKGIVLPRHMLEGTNYINKSGKHVRVPGLLEINDSRAKVYGSENRDPLTVNQVEKIHKDTLDEHFKKPYAQQLKDEQAALQRLRDAKHIGRTANTLDKSEKTDTILHEDDNKGIEYSPWSSKGVAGFAPYISGHGDNMKFHILNTCPGAVEGCRGPIKNGIVDTSEGSCFATKAEAQYVHAAVRRACHEQAKHDPAMTKDWILAHAGSLRYVADSGDKKGKKVLFRPNVVDETDRSSRVAIDHLNDQRKAINAEREKTNLMSKFKNKLKMLHMIITNAYGKVGDRHDPENGHYVTYSNTGPKVKDGRSIQQNISRDDSRVRDTITAQEKNGDDYTNRQGNKTPTKGSYLVTNVKKNSDMDSRMKRAFTHAKYWSRGRDINQPFQLSEEEKQQPPEAHYDGEGNETTPDQAHYGHITIGNRRYDYQKQHILHPRIVYCGTKVNKKTGEARPIYIPTDSRFKDTDYLPPEQNRFKSKNGKDAGHIMMVTPTESTSTDEHHTAFTHSVDESDLAHAARNNGEYEIDNPYKQEAAIGKPFVEPKVIHQMPRVTKYSGGSIHAHGNSLSEDDMLDESEGDESNEFPSQSYRAMAHNAHRELGDEAEGHETHSHTHKHPKRDGVNQLVDRAM